MFSKELENLIQATLEDGMLEENEKAALIKRAQREGVDLDELEIYINSLLQKRQRQLDVEKSVKREQYIKETKDAMGPVCPLCGKQVPPLTLKCDCGYEFTSNNHSSFAQSFFDKINNIQLTEAEIDSCSEIEEELVGKQYRVVKDNNGNVVKKVDHEKLEKLKKEKKKELIQSLPVPNTKEDIIEVLSLAATKSKLKGGLLGTIKGRLIIAIPVGLLASIIIIAIFAAGIDDDEAVPMVLLMGVFAFIAVIIAFLTNGKGMLEENKIALLWRDKFNQILMKGRSLRGDSDFQRQLDYYESLLNKK